MIFEAAGLKTLQSQNYILSDLFPQRDREDSPKLMEKTWLHLLAIVHCLFFFFSINLWHFLHAVITDKDDERSKLNICSARCCSMHMQTHGNQCVSEGGSLTVKTTQMDLLTLFSDLLVRPCCSAVDSTHKYTRYWLNTYDPTIPSDEWQTFMLEGRLRLQE